jgi:Arc/MetJ-type ribon-helix-helix transcriptional regulator
MRVTQPKAAFVMRGQFEAMSEALRQTIRDLLREELHKIRKETAESDNSPERVTEEAVAINTDQDLARFVRRVLAISRDTGGRAAVESGRHVFRLEMRGSTSEHGYHNASPAAAGSAVIQIDKGVITEKQAMNIPEEVGIVRISKGVQLTPLANDVIRRTGKKIERLKQ